MGKVRCSYCRQLVTVYQPTASASLRYMQHRVMAGDAPAEVCDGSDREIRERRGRQPRAAKSGRKGAAYRVIG